mgnify:CR=1 FL=1
MLEIPESSTIADQLNHTVKSKTILNVYANSSPHKFAWYFGDPKDYSAALSGRRIDNARANAGQVEIFAQDYRILLSDGVNIRYFDVGEKRPSKHQLLIEFKDSSSLLCSVQMYGGLWVFKDGENHNPYYHVAKEKPTPLENGFSPEYFQQLLKASDLKTLSAKGFLATEQRIPGLGNGVLQDILFYGAIHPKRVMWTLSDSELYTLFWSIKNTLANMTTNGGRDTERDLFASFGRYKTIMSKKNLGKPCPICGTTIKKETYMGGSIYFCEDCQRKGENPLEVNPCSEPYRYFYI